MTKLTALLALAIVTFAGPALAQRDVVPEKKPFLDGFDGPTLSLGARVGRTTAAGTITLPLRPGVQVTDAYNSSGASVGGEVGLHFSPAWTFFGSYDYGWFGETSMSVDRYETHSAGAGFRATTNRRGHVGFVVELGAGYRWLALSNPGATYIGHGVEPLRGGIGITVLTTAKVRVNLMTSIAAGFISHLDFAGDGCVGEIDSCDVVPEADRQWQIYRSFTVGGTFDL